VLGVDGGASSSLLGTLFTGMADADLPPDKMTSSDWAQALEAGLRAVSRQSKARVGDKTMMDALIPAVEAARARANAGDSLPEVLQAVASAAQLGAESTCNLIARHGRARSLGERTRGHQDAGATSIALIFKGFMEGIGNARS
jgi:phosphoenolpyruvate---glycerone phosphotransferase subunit DhaL